MRELVPIPAEEVLRRLELEERAAGDRLRELEGRLLRFEQTERPAYERWVRLEFGPLFSALEELHGQVHARQRLANRVIELVESQGLDPREALYQALHGDKSPKDGPWDSDEIEARRQAKREAKREARRANRRAEKNSRERPHPSPEPNRTLKRSSRELLSLYRKLARRLHPDSSEAIRGELAQDLWLKVQAAYRAQSIERLHAIWIWLDEGLRAEEADRPLSFGERFDQLQAIRRMALQIEQKLKRLMREQAWGFGTSEGIPRKKLRARARRDIEFDVARAQEALQALEDFIRQIGTPRPPRSKKRTPVTR